VNQILINIGGNFGTIVWNNETNSDYVDVGFIKRFIFEKTHIPVQDQNIIFNGKFLQKENKLEINNYSAVTVLQLKLPIFGGKGGFGALLRGAGAKAGKNLKVSNDDCRDLNGRRIRHVKNEQRLAEWYTEQKKKENEKENEKETKKRRKWKQLIML